MKINTGITGALLALGTLMVAACGRAPLPEPTVVPTATFTPEPPATATPTLGPREFFTGVFCWKSPIDVGEFNLLRFFSDGTVLEATVAPFADCADAWGQMQEHMTLEKAQAIGHGKYYLSETRIQFELAAPNTDTIVGEVTGTYDGHELVLIKGGATQEYSRVNAGE